jgi:transposase-like protein
MIQSQSPSDSHPVVPDPEVNGRPKRRTFTAEYKLRILREADTCDKPGQVGALLRREGLYSSHLTEWRRLRDQGSLRGLAPKKRGRKISEKRSNPLTTQVAKLEKQNRRLQEELRKAHLIIDVQKKVADLLGIPLPPAPSSDAKTGSDGKKRGRSA